MALSKDGADGADGSGAGDLKGLTVREAWLHDASAMAVVHVTSWQSTYPGLLPAEHLARLSVATASMRWRAVLSTTNRRGGSFVAEDPGGSVVGIAACGPLRVPLAPYEGEIYAIYLLEEVQGRGLGARLMVEMARRMLVGGLRSAVVWCLRDNPSRWFYERLGGVRVAERPLRYAGANLVEVAYGWPDLDRLASRTV